MRKNNMTSYKQPLLLPRDMSATRGELYVWVRCCNLVQNSLCEVYVRAYSPRAAMGLNWSGRYTL